MLKYIRFFKTLGIANKEIQSNSDRLMWNVEPVQENKTVTYIKLILNNLFNKVINTTYIYSDMLQYHKSICVHLGSKV